MTASSLSRRIAKLEACAEEPEGLTDLDALRLAEALARSADGLAMLTEAGLLGAHDAEEARWRAFYARPDVNCPAPLLDGEDGRWPVLRGKALWYERTYPPHDGHLSAATEAELRERITRRLR
jgi:hypothetical protein